MAGGVPLDPVSPEVPSGFSAISGDGRWHFAWSGRIDNRDDFARRFATTAGASDGQLAADVIAGRGIEALGAAIGDFAVAAWDSRERCLWLARDAIGFRPLFYFRDGEDVWFSNELRWLTSGPARQRGVNEGYIAEVLTGVAVSADETHTEGVRRVLPAEALGFEFGKGEPRRLTLWRPPLSIPPRRRDEELIEEFHERFIAAVSRSIGSEPRVSTQLSGGLDSTAVTSAAKVVTGEAPDAYSLVYPSFPTSPDGAMVDESPFIDAAVEAIGSRSVRIEPLGADRRTRADFLRVTTAHGDLPDFPATDALIFPLFRRAAADGHRVMLTGMGGDYWLTGSASRLAALIRGGRWLEAWRFQRDARSAETIDATASQIRAHLLARLAPEWAKSLYRRLHSPRVWPEWLPDDFAARVSLGPRMRRLSARAPRVKDDVLQDSLLMLTLGGPLFARESAYRAATDAGIDVRHPMLDREFVEFVMALPDDLRMRNRQSRFILRRALAPLLPPAIRDRSSKGDATSLVAVASAELLAGRTSLEGRASARGWIDAARLSPRVRSLAAGDVLARVPEAGDDLLWAAIAVDVWLNERGA